MRSHQRPRMRVAIVAAGLLSILISTSAMAGTEISSGTVTGRVFGPHGSPLGGVTVRIANGITGFSAVRVTTGDGLFAFYNIPLNPYILIVDEAGFRRIEEPVEIRSAAPREIVLRLEQAALNTEITVTARTSPVQIELETSSSHVDIDRTFIDRAPAALSSRAMEQILTATPGFAKDENGRFHFQGAHSQSEYVIDGQTISDQTGPTFSTPVDPAIAQSLEVIYGNIPADIGEKPGAVFNMTTRSGLGAGPLKGEAFFGMSRSAAGEAGVTAGFGSDTFGIFTSLSGSTSRRFLDPVNFENLHNRGESFRGFLRADWAAGRSDRFRLTVMAGRTDRDVPDTFTQNASGQDQRIETSDANVGLGWQRFLSSSAVLDVSAFGRLSDFELRPSAGDAPVTASSRRRLDNLGVSASLVFVAGAHELKTGVVYKRIPVKESFAFGLTGPGLNDPDSEEFNPALAAYDLTRGGKMFSFGQSRTGTYGAVYIRDTMRLGNLTADVGLRYERNTLPVSEDQIEPRIGAAYHIPSTRSVLRASYNRLFFTPEYENILFSSSAQAGHLAPPAIRNSRVLGGGLLPVRSERQDAYTLGFQQAIGSHLRLDADVWFRRSTGAGDQDQFLNTGIVFPLAFSKGRMRGWDIRLDFVDGGLRGFLSFGHTRAVYYGPPVGGLFIDAGALEDLAGGPFLIDHDQNLQGQAGVICDIAETGLWLGTNVRYDSGLVTGADPGALQSDPDNSFAIPYIRVHGGGWEDPNRVTPRTIADFSIGYDPGGRFPLAVQIDVLNAFDRKGVYNILSVFGGTHVIPPRSVACRVKARF